MKLCVNSIYLFLGCIFLSELANTASIQRPSRSECNKKETFFKRKNVYTYHYTITTSSFFAGVSDSKSGSQIACSVTFKVPRYCEVLMQISDCSLKEKKSGTEDWYEDVLRADGFLQDLERYELYFQTSNGLILNNSIVADNGESVTSLNIKRGILSAVEFQILEADQYEKPLQEADIFGTCQTKYTFSSDKMNTIHTHRNLRECSIPQVFKKQFTNPASLIRPLAGGYTEEPISEMIYPFVSEIGCDYRLDNDEQLNHVTCEQIQYFKPLAHTSQEGEINTAYVQVSQDLKLVSSVEESLPRPDESLNGRSIINIKFDFAGGDMQTFSESEVSAAFQNLLSEYENGGYTYKNVPASFEQLVYKFRHTTSDVLEALRPSADQQVNLNFYLDGLNSCGSEACMRSVVSTLKAGGVDWVHELMFIGSLTHLPDVPETVVSPLYDYISSQKKNVLMPMGTILSHQKHSKNVPLTADLTLGRVLEDILAKLEEQCDTDTPLTAHRELRIAIKTLENIGRDHAIQYVLENYQERPFLTAVLQCLINKNVPVSARRDVVQLFDSTSPLLSYKGTPDAMRDILFTILDDRREDITLRALTFTTLAKTTDLDIVRRLMKKVTEKDDVEQLLAYMVSNIRTLLEGSTPEMANVTAAWTSVFQQNPVNFDIPDAYSPKTSKTIDLSGFLKHGLSEMFGGNLYVDIVYDPAFNILSMMRLSLNYHIRDHKYNIAEVTLDIKGFDLLMDVIMRKTDMTLSDLYALYKMAQGQGHAQGSSQGEEKVAKFQRNIIKAVNAIIDKVNHPGMNFDLGVNLKLKGKNIVFASLQELIAMVREAKNPQSGQPFSPEKFLHQLMAGMDVFKRFKNIEWISLQKILPTCAGLPMNMSVSVAGFNKIDIDLQSNLALFMGKVSPNVEATSSQSVIYATTMTGQLTIPIGGSTHSSGLQMRIGLNSERGARMRVKYGYDDLIVKTANPTKEKIEFYLQPILMSGDSKTSEQLLHADGRMFLLHHSGHEELSREAAFEKTYTRCLDSKKSLLLGRSFCVVAKYPDVKASDNHAYFPLSGPFDMAVTMEVVDKVGWYELRFEYFVEQETGGALVDNLQFTHTGKGDMMSRLFNIHIKFNRQNRSLTVDSAFPEIEWNYQGDWTSYHSDTLYEYYYKDLISVKDHPYLGIILKKYIYLDGKDRQYIFNITHPSFGVDVRAEMHAENMEDSLLSKNMDLSFTYYCSQTLPFMYMLHLDALAAMRNGDKTTLQLSRSKQNTGSMLTNIQYYEHTVNIESTTEYSPGNTQRHHVITYEADGVQKTMTVQGNILSSKDGATVTYNGVMDMTGEDFTIHVKSSVAIEERLSFSLTSEIDYVNNESSRKKRSLSSIYDKFDSVEKASNEEEVAVRSQDGDQANPTEIEVEKTPDRPNLPKPPPVPVIPSIWDLPAWQTKLTINHVVKPIFHSEKALPGALEFVTDVTLKNPWNAGYRNFEAQLVFGYQIHTTFKNFHFWSHGDGNVTYTSLSGAPTPDTDGSPLLEHYCGNFNIHRVASKTFDFAWEHSDPSLEYEFVVGFDWDAYTHHKPLYFVRAHMENKLVPFFTFNYREQFLNEENHKKHSLAFNHAIFNITMDTDYMIKPLQFTNNGSVSLQVFGKGGGFSFENKLQRIPGAPVQAPPMLVCEIRPNSQPVALVYSFMFTGPMTVQMKSSMIMPGAKFPVLLWTMEFKPVGSSIVFIKVSWEPSFDQKVLENTQQRPLLYSRLVSAVADHVRGEINKPIMEKNLPFTEMSLSTVAKTVLGPYVFKTVMGVTMISQNMIPLKYRLVPGQISGPPARLALFFKLLQEQGARKKEAHPAMKAFEMAHFLALKTFSKAYLVWVSNLVRGPKMKEVLDKRSYTVAFDMHVNLMKQGLKESTKQIWGTLSYNLAKVKPIFVERKQPPALPIAMVTRHHDGSGDWIVQTYKDRFLSIPAMKAKECTYLLLADASRRQYSLVLSPVGVTVVTPETSISIGWDKRVTVDNCKLERKDGKITSGGLTVVTNDDLITLTTNFGLKVFCDRLDVDSCHFYMTAKRNSTIGLFGINDGSKYTDMRLLNGQITSDTGSLLAAYAVAGPSSCYEQGTNQQPDCEPKGACSTDQPCPYGPPELCFDTMKAMSSCSMDDLEAVCKATPCSDGDDKVCKVVANLVRKCKIQLQIAEEFMPQEECWLPQALESFTSSKTGPLDIVFVLSQHLSMDMSDVAKDSAPYKYLLGLLLTQTDGWEEFSDVRLGIVTFGGDAKEGRYDPAVLQSGDDSGGNGYFIDREDYGFENLANVWADGDKLSDGFEALRLAAQFPFRPTAHKIAVLIMTKEQSSGSSDDLNTLSSALTDQGIVLNVFSTYAKTSSRRIMGINWEENIITKQDGYQDIKDMPNNDYVILIKETKGALWDLNVVKNGRDKQLNRVVDEFVAQTRRDNAEYCPAA
ncbi:uncharacterized protein LOC128214920 [Mya arenaria]|uniref:uncharacterized protein LOC128214920 n=1 Tax=Mya arenaria TaxID=6604 RepID=UPI0022E4EB69|nr:uncharacterized protein LOC128214920 [Mya arenaria]